MRVPFIAGNWKMNKTPADTKTFINGFLPLVKDVKNVDIAIMPVFTCLETASEKLEGSNVGLGAQNMHFETSGAFTGEISGEMLQASGCKYVILGHSERRQIFKEDDEYIAKKIRKALDLGLIPVICVGELLEEREANRTEAVLKNQIEKAFKVIKAEEASKVVVAYEPIWAIGTGVNATKEDAQSGTEFIRKTLAATHVSGSADKIRILYGGSVKSFNIAEYMAQPDIDGALVGGASLDPEAFSKIVKYDAN